jgi:hypothetical protein
MALPREVDHWWRQRSQMRVVRAGRGWRIEGAGRERASVAFATRVGDTLAFTFEDRRSTCEALAG